jgi:hypothetical protein
VVLKTGLEIPIPSPELTKQELTKRVDLPLDWAEQMAQLGFD